MILGGLLALIFKCAEAQLENWILGLELPLEALDIKQFGKRH